MSAPLARWLSTTRKQPMSNPDACCPKCRLERWQFVDYKGETWNRCHACGWGELWAGGQLIKSRRLYLPSAAVPESSDDA